MLESARAFCRHFTEQRIVGVGELHQRHRGCETEYLFCQKNQQVGKCQETGVERKFHEIVPVVVWWVGIEFIHFRETGEVVVD